MTETAIKPLNEQYHEQVEALKAEGLSNADAIRQVAVTHGKTLGAIRGSLYQYKTKHSGGPSTPRRSRSARTSVDDLLASARQSLMSASALIDAEVAEAKAALDAAQARYDELLGSVEQRKADIDTRLKALA